MEISASIAFYWHFLRHCVYTVECACYLRVCANNYRCLSLRAQHFLARMTSVWLFFVLAVCILSGYIKTPGLCSTMPKRENHLLLYAGLPWNIAARSVEHLRANNSSSCCSAARHSSLKEWFWNLGSSAKYTAQKEKKRTKQPLLLCRVLCAASRLLRLLVTKLRPAVDFAVPQGMN